MKSNNCTHLCAKWSAIKWSIRLCNTFDHYQYSIVNNTWTNIALIALLVAHIGQSFQFRHILHNFAHNIGITRFDPGKVTIKAAAQCQLPLLSARCCGYRDRHNDRDRDSGHDLASASEPVSTTSRANWRLWVLEGGSDGDSVRLARRYHPSHCVRTAAAESG